MKLETSYEKDKLSIYLINESNNTYYDEIKIIINEQVVKEIDYTEIPPGSKFTCTIDIKLDQYENIIKVEYATRVLSDKIIVPECKLACKLLTRNIISIYNPYDNLEVKDIHVKTYFWDSDPQDDTIESIKPGSGVRVKLYDDDISEVLINNRRVMKTY